MIEPVPTLTLKERRALTAFLDRILADGAPPIRGAFLFGSKARGDFDRRSDVDVLFICDIPPDLRHDAAAMLGAAAEAIGDMTGVVIEPWAVPAADLEQGWRTPMLIDALEDGVRLWPRGAPPLHLPFTPADALFCADCLVDWVDEGGPIVRQALREGRWDVAAQRARDDITRLATSALLLSGETRHRRVSSLQRFERQFVRPRIVSPRVLPALQWAAAAYPPDGGRGLEHPPASPTAVQTAPLGYELASLMEEATLPVLLDWAVNLARPTSLDEALP